MKRLFTIIIAFIACLSVYAREHTVQRGESLESIAKAYNISVDDLIKANPEVTNLFFVGVKLQIPEVANAVEVPSVGSTAVSAPEKVSGAGSLALTAVPESSEPTAEDPFETNRYDTFAELVYSGVSFKDAKGTGSYGFAFTALYGRIAHRTYLGLRFAPFQFNYGLVPKEYASDLISIGPAVGFYFTESCLVTLPVEASCRVYFDGNSNTKTTWGMSISPTFFAGGRFGIFLGPQFTIGFSKGSKMEAGFRVGLCFGSK